MAIIRAVSKITVANKILVELAEGAKEKLLKYSTARVIELGLATKLYKSTFPIGADYGESIRSMGRLRTLLFKHLQKNIPYINMANREYFTLYDRDKFSVQISSAFRKGGFEKKEDFPSFVVSPDFKLPSNYEVYRSNSYKTDYLLNTKLGKSLNRYTRYLNYIFRKYRIPLHVQVISQLEWDEAEIALLAVKGSKVLDTALLKNRTVHNLIYTISAWKPNSSLAFEEAQKDAAQRDRFFALASAWQPYAIIGNDPATAHGTVDYSPAKLFLHLDKAGKLLSTLTRKTSYDSTAYSFGNS